MLNLIVTTMLFMSIITVSNIIAGIALHHKYSDDKDGDIIGKE